MFQTNDKLVGTENEFPADFLSETVNSNPPLQTIMECLGREKSYNIIEYILQLHELLHIINLIVLILLFPFFHIDMKRWI